MRYWPIFSCFLLNTELSKYKKISRTIKQHPYVYYYMYIHLQGNFVFIPKSSPALSILILVERCFPQCRLVFLVDDSSLVSINSIVDCFLSISINK